MEPELVAWLDQFAGYRKENRSEAIRHILELVRDQHPDPRPGSPGSRRPVEYRFEPADCPHRYIRTDGTCGQCGIQRRPPG